MKEKESPSVSRFHPFLQMWQRYASAFSMAWSKREELDGPKRSSHEVEFLPAALSLQETPPHPLPRRLAWALAVLFVFALAWACLGRVDIVALAPGRVVVSERTKLVQPLEASVVRQVFVKDGDRVRAGQVLVTLDPTIASADRSNVHELYLAAVSEGLRSTALLHALKGTGGPRLSESPDSSLDITAVNWQLQSEWQDIVAKRSKLQAEIARKEAEILTVRASLEKLEATLPLSRQREADYLSLVGGGHVSNHATQDRTRERMELERDLITQRARILESQAALRESVETLNAYLAETRRSLYERQSEAETKRAQLRAESTKAEQRERLTQLVAPVAGVVQQLGVHSTGGVVTSAQPLMVIVPDSDEVTALVQVANLDIGFLKVGQAAAIKLETFPYTQYGTIPASISVLGKDAIIDEKTGMANYPATLTLMKTNLQVDGRLVPISPGMNVVAEIKTGERRIIEYLLSPVARASNESLRER